MKLRDFRVGWRMLTRQAGYSAVLVLGLSIGLAAFFLLLSYVRYSFSYDSAIPDAGRVYLIKMKINLDKPMWLETTPLPFLEVARRSGTVETSALIQPLPSTIKAGPVTLRKVQVAAVDPSFASIFGLRTLEGNLHDALSRPDMLAVTESLAKGLFGNTRVLGETVQVEGRSYQIAALLEDPPSNSSLRYHALASVNTSIWNEEQRRTLSQNWGYTEGARLFVKLKPGASPRELETILQQASDNSPLRSQLPAELLASLGNKKLMELRLGAVPDMYFDRDTVDTPGSLIHGDIRVVLGLSAVAILIIFLAIINYVNLAAVQTLRRQREIAVRKVLGTSISGLAGMFMAESLIVSLISTVIGLLAAAGLMPVFARLMDRELGNMLNVQNIVTALVVGVGVGLVSGAYPAWMAMRMRPAHTLAGRGSSETRGALQLRRVLTVTQFATAITLVGVTGAIVWQTYFASHVYPGFDASQLMVMELPGEATGPAHRSLREALAALPGVSGVAGAREAVGHPFTGRSNTVTYNDKHVLWPVPGVSKNFFDVYGVRPLAGRLFNQSDNEESGQVAVLNSTAVPALGFASADAAIGQIVTVGGGPTAQSVKIVGVAPDLRYESLRQMPQPMLYMLTADLPVLTLKGGGESLQRAAETLQQKYFPNDVITLRPLTSVYAENYADDLRLVKLLGLGTLVAIAIAAFGIYVLSAYTVQRLTKQIVIRKLFGAEAGAIAGLVGREFLILISVGSLIGLPLSAFAIQYYLGDFVTRAPIGIWTLLGSMLVVLVVTIASTLRQTFIAMRMSPIEALRH